MKSRLSKSEQNRADAASLLFELEEEAELQREPMETRSRISKGVRPDRIISDPENFQTSAVMSTADKLSQTEAKVEPKWVQTEAKVEPKIDNVALKVKSNLSQKPEPIADSAQKVEPQPEPLHKSKLSQSGFKVEPNRSILSLVGLQQNSLFLIYESCRLNGSKISAPITIQNFSTSLKTTPAAVRKALQRLEQKQFIVRELFKDGRGGWTQYGVPEVIYSQLLSHETRVKVEPNLGQTRVKVEPQPEPQPEPSPPSSSREVFYKSSSTTQSVVSDELASLELSELREVGITIETFKRAVQLHPAVTIEGLQDLAFRLSELFKNPKERAKIQNARGFVIKLVEQLAHGITPLDHIETLNDRLMREYADLAKKKKIEQAGFEETALQEAFEKWDREIEEEAKLDSIPLARSAPKGAPRTAVLRQHFRENIWPETRERILKGEL